MQNKHNQGAMRPSILVPAGGRGLHTLLMILIAKMLIKYSKYLENNLYNLLEFSFSFAKAGVIIFPLVFIAIILLQSLYLQSFLSLDQNSVNLPKLNKILSLIEKSQMSLFQGMTFIEKQINFLDQSTTFLNWSMMMQIS